MGVLSVIEPKTVWKYFEAEMKRKYAAILRSSL